jgi:hypothetical protein
MQMYTDPGTKITYSYHEPDKDQEKEWTKFKYEIAFIPDGSDAICSRTIWVRCHSSQTPEECIETLLGSWALTQGRHWEYRVLKD